MNAATGAPINGPDGTQLEAGGVLGGLYANGAVDQKAGIVFQNGNDWPYGSGSGSGDLYAVSLDGALLWDYKTPAQDGSGVAIANGVVYFQSFDGYLYMLNEHATSASDALLAKVYTGSQYGGPAVADGHIFQGTGEALNYFFFGDSSLTGSIISLGLPYNGADDRAAVAGPTLGGAGLSSDAVPDVSAPILGSIGADPIFAAPGPAPNALTVMPAELAASVNDPSFIAVATASPAINQGQLAGNRKNPWSSLLQIAAGLQG
jgi:hypothetical protein